MVQAAGNPAEKDFLQNGGSMVSFRESYDNELKELRNLLVVMCSQVEHDFERLFEALEKDEQDVIEAIIDKKDVVDEMERKIESKCLSLITRQQPIAKDLRKITTALKVAGDLEREGDHIIDIAELLLRLNLSRMDSFSVHLKGMGTAAQEMIHNSVEAFINSDEKAAEAVIASDDVVDELFNKVKNDLVKFIKAGSKDMDECIDVLMIAKYLEKMGDHAVNIGEWTIFQETGAVKNIRLI